MNTPPALSAALEADEHLLWHSPAAGSGKLSDYRGPHELIARLFFAVSAIMALIFFLGMQDAGRLGVSVLLLVCVGGPVVLGFIVRYVGRHRARTKARSTHYAVTSRRILTIQGATRSSKPIDAHTVPVATAHQMILPTGQAAKAEAAITQVKATL